MAGLGTLNCPIWFFSFKLVVILICIHFIFTHDKLPILFNIIFPNLRGGEEKGGGALRPWNFVYWQTGKMEINLVYWCNYCGMTCNDMSNSVIDTQSHSSNASLCEAGSAWYRCEQRAGPFLTECVCVCVCVYNIEYSTVLLHLTWHVII